MKMCAWGFVVAFTLVGSVSLMAMTLCFFNYELASSGLTKICVYDCLGSPAAITVSAVAVCPLSIHQ